MKHTNSLMLLIACLLLAYVLATSQWLDRWTGLLAERTVNALVLSIEDSRSLQQSAIDSMAINPCSKTEESVDGTACWDVERKEI